MMTLTVSEDLLEELETALEYLDRARDILCDQGQADLAADIQSVLEQLEAEIMNLEAELDYEE